MFLLLWLLVAQGVRGQFPGAESADALRNGVFVEWVHGVSFGLSSWELAPPILQPADPSVLVLSFDVLDTPPATFSYRVVHCDAHWQPSGLLESEYMSGFIENRLPGPQLSEGTMVPYAHYELRLPNEEVRFKISGNYVVQVVDPYAGGRVVLQQQFAVSEDMVRIEIGVRQASGVDRLSHQRVECSMDMAPLGRFVAPGDAVLFCKQAWSDGCFQQLRQSGYRGATVWLYGGLEQGAWPGGNEWHTLDLQSLAVAGAGVRSIVRGVSGYDVEVEVDNRLGFLRYLSRSDLNGYSVVGVSQDRRALQPKGAVLQREPLCSEYVWAYFSLVADVGLDASGVRLEIGGVGEYSGGVPMRYDAVRGQYECSLLLKQGVYSYRYVVGGIDAQGCVDTGAVEGSFQETENDYHALLYYRGPGDRWDRLVGYGSANSRAGAKR